MKKGKTSKRNLPARVTLTDLLFERIIDVLGGMGKLILVSTLSPGNLHAAINPTLFFQEMDERQQYRMRRALHALKEKRYITLRKKGSQLEFSLTDRGLERLISHRIRCAPLCGTGTCLMVTFDIPEDIRSVRRTLRQFLKQHNFTQVQKSVWVTEREIEAELTMFLEKINADEWVRIYRAERVDGSSPRRRQ